LRKTAKAVGGRLIQADRHIDVNCVVIGRHWCSPHLRLRGNRDGDGLTDQDLNIKAVLLDTAADAGAAAGVAVTGAIIFVTGRWNWLDPAVALVIAVVIGYHAGGLIWRVLGALGIPTRDDTST
jgi:Co/Zn/Cd efflux system component